MSAEEQDDEAKRKRLADVERALSVVEARRRSTNEPEGGLFERLAQARDDLSGDKRALAELSGAMDRLAAEMDAMRAKAAPEPAPAAPRSPRLLRRLLLAFALAIAAAGVVLLWMASRAEQRPADPGLQPPAEGSSRS